MTIKIQIGDLFDSGAQTLVNTVNCVGVMGRGVALEFKKRFPDMYKDYVKRCNRGEVKLGQPYLYRRAFTPWILNFPTKDHWRSVSRIKDIIDGLKFLEKHYEEWGIESLAVPPLGCGQGQLDWNLVGRTLYRGLKPLAIPVTMFAPFETPQEQLQSSFLDQPEGGPATDDPPRLDLAWIAVVRILDCIQREPYHWPIGRTSFQKIAYFATEAGIPTGLTYEKSSYGPFARSLKRQITKMVNNGLIQERSRGRMFEVRVGPTFSDAFERSKESLAKWRGTIARVVDLFTRMDTRQAELAATVHFATKQLLETEDASENDVYQQVLQWKERRKPGVGSREIAQAIRNLSLRDWIPVKPSESLPINDHEA